MEWLIQNCATIVIGAILLVAVILAVRSMIKTKKVEAVMAGVRVAAAVPAIAPAVIRMPRKVWRSLCKRPIVIAGSQT